VESSSGEKGSEEEKKVGTHLVRKGSVFPAKTSQVKSERGY